MGSFLISVLSVGLVIVSLFALLIILMQRPSDSSGFGSTLGGSAVESAFGGEAGAVLTRATVRLIALFFLFSLLLSLCYIHFQGGKKAPAVLPDSLVESNSLVETAPLAAEDLASDE